MSRAHQTTEFLAFETYCVCSSKIQSERSVHKRFMENNLENFQSEVLYLKSRQIFHNVFSSFKSKFEEISLILGITMKTSIYH
jgi:hypothetical protein